MARFRTRHHCTTGRFTFNKSSIYCQPSLKAEGKREWPADQSSQWPLETKEYGAPSQTPFPVQRQQVLELYQISRRGTEYKGEMFGSVVTDNSHMSEHLKEWRKQIKVTWVHLDKIFSVLFHTQCWGHPGPQFDRFTRANSSSLLFPWFWLNHTPCNLPVKRTYLLPPINSTPS